MNRQKGYIDIPGWFFWMVPVGIVLIAVELFRLLWWVYENVEVMLK